MNIILTYNTTKEINPSLLYNEIIASESVTAYAGFSYIPGTLEIFGDSLLDEDALIQVIIDHDATVEPI